MTRPQVGEVEVAAGAPPQSKRHSKRESDTKLDSMIEEAIVDAKWAVRANGRLLDHARR